MSLGFNPTRESVTYRIDENKFCQPFNSLSAKIDDQIILGRGTYGQIYQATITVANQVQIVAAKCSKNDEQGIPRIMEASIMATFTHKALNTALHGNIIDNGLALYILQEKAEMDLACYVKANSVSHEEVRYWSYLIIQAIRLLHRESIIHGDLKANNILIYPLAPGQTYRTVKLTDFTFAVKKWTPELTFHHSICTTTHRPLECFRGLPWSFPVDIWSAGCTLAEIVTGRALFPRQVSEPELGQEGRKRMHQRSINGILDWAGYRNESVPIPCYEIDYLSPDFSFFNSDHPILPLLKLMLVVDPAKRATIDQLFNHPYFTGLTDTRALRCANEYIIVDNFERDRVNGLINCWTTEPIVQKLAFNLFNRADFTDERDPSDRLKSFGCVWIASKLVFGKASLPVDPALVQYQFPDLAEPNSVTGNYHAEEVWAMERKICHYLRFRLHGVI